MTNKEAIEFLKNMIDTQSVGAVLPNGEKALWQYHIEALNMAISALQPHWVPVTEAMPEEDYCTGRGIQHSADVLVTIVNHADDDDAFVNMAFTVDGKWQLTNPIDYDGDTDVPEWCEIIAFMPSPEPWKGEQ